MPNTPGVADHAADAETDARSRALRTFVQGLGLDVVVAAALAVSDSVQATGFDWRLLGLAVAKTIVTTAVSYVARKAVPPPA